MIQQTISPCSWLFFSPPINFRKKPSEGSLSEGFFETNDWKGREIHGDCVTDAESPPFLCCFRARTVCRDTKAKMLHN